MAVFVIVFAGIGFEEIVNFESPRLIYKIPKIDVAEISKDKMAKIQPVTFFGP